MTPDERAAHRVGPGGYKCRCCGPAPKAWRKHRRLVRRRMKAAWSRLTRSMQVWS